MSFFQFEKVGEVKGHMVKHLLKCLMKAGHPFFSLPVCGVCHVLTLGGWGGARAKAGKEMRVQSLILSSTYTLKIHFKIYF